MKHRGLMFAILYCATTCMSFSQFKIVPILGQLTADLGITTAESSWMMSVFTVAAIILAIPIGGIVAKFGPKKPYIIVLSIMVIGNVIGAFSLNNYPLLLFSRILEGCAFAIWNVAGVVLVNMWYPGKNNGLFIGIFMTFAAIASFIMLNAAVPITQALGTASLWWIVAGLTLVFTILFALFVKEPEAEAADAQATSASTAEKPSLSRIFTNKAVMALCVSQLVIGFVLYFFLNNYPTLFTGCYALDATTANFYGSMGGLWGVPFCILGGFILDKLGKGGTPKLAIFCYILLFITCGVSSILVSPLFLVHTLFIAGFTGLILTSNNYLVPKCVDRPQDTGFGMGVLTLFYNIGIFIGSPIILYAVEGTGNWMFAAIILAAMAAIGFLATIVYISQAKKHQAS